MRNPPVAVKRTLEAVYLLLESAGGSGGASSKWTAAKKAIEGPRSPGSKTSVAGLARTLSRRMSVGHGGGDDGLEWDRVIARICKSGLVDAITQFDVAAAGPEDVRRLKEHVKNAKLTSEAVGRASKACEPLWVWVQGQLQLAPLLSQHTCANLAEEETNMQVRFSSGHAAGRATVSRGGLHQVSCRRHGGLLRGACRRLKARRSMNRLSSIVAG